MIKPTRAAGLELSLLPNNEWRMTLCVLAVDKGRVMVVDQIKGLTSVGELRQHLPDGMPVALVVDGKSILHKRIALEENGSVHPVERLKSMIPNLSLPEFCLQSYFFHGGAYLSLIRQETLDQLLAPLRKAGIWVVQATTGPFGVSTLLRVLEAREALVFNGYHLTLQDWQIQSYRTTAPSDSESSPVFMIGEEKLAGEWLLAYAAALGLLTGQPDVPALSFEGVTANRHEWEQRRIFRVGSWAALLSLLMVLLVNFLLFSRFSHQNAQLLAQTDGSDTSTEKMARLRTELSERQQFFRAAGWLTPTRSSFYADQLASTIPREITLTELALEPLHERQSKIEKKMLFMHGTIRVQGWCSGPQILNDWLKAVHELTWVGQIKDQNYRYEPAKGAGFFNFQIVLKETKE